MSDIAGSFQELDDGVAGYRRLIELAEAVNFPDLAAQLKAELSYVERSRAYLLRALTESADSLPIAAG